MVSQKGNDGKMHKVTRSVYKCSSIPGELRISRTLSNGTRSYVKFKEVKKINKNKQKGGDDICTNNNSPELCQMAAHQGCTWGLKQTPGGGTMSFECKKTNDGFRP